MSAALLLAQAPDAPAAPAGQLIAAALLGIAVIVVLISWLHVHPFLALILGSAVLGVVGGLGPEGTIDSFGKGVGDTVGNVGVLIALGAMIGGLLADSGGADRVVDAVTSRFGGPALPWAMAGVAALIGLPLFFEVGVVLLVPVVLLVAARARVPVLAVGLPALAGLSVLHGLVPPHPGPLIAISSLGADLGLTLAFGLLVAVPTVVVSGPLLAKLVVRWVPLPAAGTGDAPEGAGAGGAARPADKPGTASRDTGRETEPARRRVGVGAAVAVVLTPVGLMLVRAIAEMALPEGDPVRGALEIAGEPVVALLAGVLLAMLVLGAPAGLDRRAISASVGGALPAIAGILLIVGAGGGFKETLIEARVGDLVGRAAEGAALSPLVLGWLIAVGIRVATGSATVATVTAAGIVAPLALSLDAPTVALLALAIGAGSLFFSHVNDAGFWLVKEYFGLTVGQTVRSWSLMETVISVVGLVFVLLLSVVV